MDTRKKSFIKFSESSKLMPQEETLEVQRQKSSLTIGVPRETFFQENRVALCPSAVGLLIENGHRVLVESDAGKAAHFPNNEYSDVGAQIVYSPEEVYKADLILKIGPLSTNEIDMLLTKQTIISALHITAQNIDYFKKMMAKKMTALTYECIKDKTNTYPLIRSISEITGTTSIFLAAEYLSNPTLGKGSIFGGFSGISPTEVVILGAGTVAEFAARAAIGLGATVKIFDNSIYKLRRIQGYLNQRVFTSIIEPHVLLKSLKTADVVIGALHSSEGRTPCVVSEDMVRQMKYGSVIIDVSIDQGGCVETSRPTTHADPVFKKYDVIHYCVPNIPSRVPRTASYALSNFFTPIILNIGEEGGIENMLKANEGVRQGVYMYHGILTNKYIGETYNIPYQDIELLMAAFH